MNSIIPLDDNDIEQFHLLQFEDFLTLYNLYLKFIFGFDREAWIDIASKLEDVLKRCNIIDYQDDSTAIAYSVFHFLDRYHRMQIMLGYLLDKRLLNRSRKYDVLDVGTGPSQVLYALSDYFTEINIIKGKEVCTFNLDYAEKSKGFRYFMHHFSEEAMRKGKQYYVPFHLGRVFDFQDITFNETYERLIGVIGKTRRIYDQKKYRYDIVVFNNFLTTKDFLEQIRYKIRLTGKFMRNNGLIIVIGSASDNGEYKDIYSKIDNILFSQKSNKYYVVSWRKIIDKVFNYKYDDDYGRIIGTYFKSVYDYLNDNKLWAAVPQYAQNEIENNIKLLTVENKNSTWKGIKWRMVVYKKRSKYR